MNKVLTSQKQIRWYHEAKKKSVIDDEWAWVRRDDIYDGWFHDTGDDTPNDALVEQFNAIKQREDWLDHRLVCEKRANYKTVIMQ
jgi:hypothetical protein